jgi:RimJ/RimL family protein N-acetyltransferase
MNLLFGHDETVAEWVGRVVGKPFHAPYTAIGIIDREGTLRGGFVFNNHHDAASIELSLAGNVASRSAWRGVLHYVFVQLGCKRLSIHTRKSNKAVRKQAPRLGFKFEGIARSLYGDEDGLCYSLTANDLAPFRSRWKLG